MTYESGRIIALLPRASAILLIVSYTLGFIIVNSYLATYGYTGIADIFKLRYLVAGILFVTFCLPLFCLVFIFSWYGIDPAIVPDWKRRRAIMATTYLGVATLMMLFVFTTLGETLNKFEEFPMKQLSMGVIFAYILVGVFSVWKIPEKLWQRILLNGVHIFLPLGVLLASIQYKALMYLVPLGMMLWEVAKPINSTTSFSSWPIQSLVAFVYAPVFLFLSAAVFGASTYSKILPQFGGGSPVEARILLTENGADSLAMLGLKTTQLLEHSLIVDVTDHEFLIVPSRAEDRLGPLLQLRRDHVRSMIFLPMGKRSE